jgi:hypothetical protein
MQDGGPGRALARSERHGGIGGGARRGDPAEPGQRIRPEETFRAS